MPARCKGRCRLIPVKGGTLIVARIIRELRVLFFSLFYLWTPFQLLCLGQFRAAGNGERGWEVGNPDERGGESGEADFRGAKIKKHCVFFSKMHRIVSDRRPCHLGLMRFLFAALFVVGGLFAVSIWRLGRAGFDSSWWDFAFAD